MQIFSYSSTHTFAHAKLSLRLEKNQDSTEVVFPKEAPYQ